MFEGKVFGYQANAPAIRENDWYGKVAPQICEAASSSILFFQQRYVLAAGAELRFNRLLGGPQGNNLRSCILQGLGEEAVAEDRVIACAAVCYRIRNNLFHGAKAAYGYAGQRGNLTHCVRFLNACLHFLA